MITGLRALESLWGCWPQVPVPPQGPTWYMVLVLKAIRICHNGYLGNAGHPGTQKPTLTITSDLRPYATKSPVPEVQLRQSMMMLGNIELRV